MEESETTVYKAPLDWAKRKGHLVAANPRQPNSSPSMSVAYKVADQLYRWTENGYHYQGEAFELQESDFDSAMLLSASYPTVEPHEAALTPYARSLRAKKVNK